MVACLAAANVRFGGFPSARWFWEQFGLGVRCNSLLKTLRLFRGYWRLGEHNSRAVAVFAAMDWVVLRPGSPEPCANLTLRTEYVSRSTWRPPGVSISPVLRLKCVRRPDLARMAQPSRFAPASRRRWCGARSCDRPDTCPHRPARSNARYAFAPCAD